MNRTNLTIMDRRLFWVTVLIAAFILNMIMTGVHEMTHVLLNFVSVGEIYNVEFGLTSNLQPFVSIRYHPNMWLTKLATPLIVSAIGLAGMLTATHIKTNWLRVAVFLIGTLNWVSQALYSTAWWGPPHITNTGEVITIGDGIGALESVGYIAQLPGVLMIAIGLILFRRPIIRALTRLSRPND